MSDYSYLDFEADLNYLYCFLQELRHEETEIDLLIEHLRILLINGVDYPEPDVMKALYQVINSPWAEREFSHFLNRCCYILINHWWTQCEFQHQAFKQAANRLVDLFLEPTSEPLTPTTRRLRKLVKQFTQTQQYQTLQCYAQLEGNDRLTSTQQTESRTESLRAGRLHDLIHRYPCLYEYYVFDSTPNKLGQKAIRQLQTQREKQFESALFNYACNLFKRSQDFNRSSISIKNPTFLKEKELITAFQQFTGPANGSFTYRDSALHFLKEAKQKPSFQLIKQQMHHYLISSLDPRHQKLYFNEWLHENLTMTLPESDDLRPTSHLVIRMCNQLVNSLIAVPSEHPKNHAVFVDLHANLGATKTIGVLLKIILICQLLYQNTSPILGMVKTRVARQFALVFRHYRDELSSETRWLIECLDNLMIAFAIHLSDEGYSKWSALTSSAEPYYSATGILMG